MKRILFVCTGNTCRSPMAEVMFRHMAEQHGLQIETKSAGVAALDGMPMSANAHQVMLEKRLDERTLSSSISAELLAWADLILTMTQSHKYSLVQYSPALAAKTHTLKEYVFPYGSPLPVSDVADPYGGTVAMYRESAQDIEQALQGLIDKLKEEEHGAAGAD